MMKLFIEGVSHCPGQENVIIAVVLVLAVIELGCLAGGAREQHARCGGKSKVKVNAVIESVNVNVPMAAMVLVPPRPSQAPRHQ